MDQPISSTARALLVGVMLVLAPVACTSAERAAQETYDLGQFEEKQGNVDHARQLYEEIVTKHPDTSWAEKARVRLSELQAPQS